MKILLNCFCTNKSTQEPFIDISLSHNCIQVILGSVLGDGSLKIQKNYKNARLQIRHSIIQKEYLLWKKTQLHEISLAKTQIQKADGFSKNQKISFQSRATKELTKIHAIVCKDNKVNIQLYWLNALDELALLVWWLDDGSLISKRTQGCLCTDGFHESCQKILQEYLFNSWKISTRIGTVFSAHLKNSDRSPPFYNRLYLNNSELQKLFHLIMPLLDTENMVRKFALQYKDNKDQERWISIMKKAMPKFHNEINRLYECL